MLREARILQVSLSLAQTYDLPATLTLPQWIAIIPHLCRKAGIPEHDNRGPITSHLARASITSQLYNAKEPLTLFELKEYLGHKNVSSTQYYARVDPTKLAIRVAKAGYLEQNMATIEVLLDQDAIRSGAAAQGECGRYLYPDPVDPSDSSYRTLKTYSQRDISMDVFFIVA